MAAVTLTGALDIGTTDPAGERVIDVRDLRMRYGTNDVLQGGAKLSRETSVGHEDHSDHRTKPLMETAPPSRIATEPENSAILCIAVKMASEMRQHG